MGRILHRLQEHARGARVPRMKEIRTTNGGNDTDIDEEDPEEALASHTHKKKSTPVN